MPLHIGVIGGGIIGIAIARSLALDYGLKVTVLEKETRLATHQTGRNSGVVHAGIYYQPGSLKAELCSRGRIMTKEFCESHGLPFRELGKLVLATEPSELDALDAIESRARANGVPGLRRLRQSEIESVEPHARGLAGLHSPHTAVVDYVAITEAMAHDLRSHGGRILLGHKVTRVAPSGKVVQVSVDEDQYEFDKVVVCAGLQSDELAIAAGAHSSPRILPFRGEYRELEANRRSLVRGLIYPVPDPRFPFLGVHFTRGVYDDVRVGPNAVPALSREGYRWGDISLRDTLGSIAWPGAASLLRKHWRMGVKEISGSLIKPLYFLEAQRFVPELRISDLSAKTRSGVRAQAWSRNGELVDDFAIDTIGQVTLLRNAPSPAATSAMAIAEHVISGHILLEP